MINGFDTYNHTYYKQLLQHLDLPFIDEELKKSKLWKILGDERFLKMESEAFNSQDPSKVYERYIRQFGTPFVVKMRPLNLEKRFDIKKLIEDQFKTYDEELHEKYKTINHPALFFDKSGDIFHFCPDGLHYGKDEYNKEICNDTWVSSNSVPFFTLMSIEEIELFCNKWNLMMKYELGGIDGSIFASLLAFWLN